MEEIERLLELLRDVNEEVDFSRETALVDDGLIDSFDIIAIIAALDEAYNIHIEAADIGPENFNSAESILKMVTAYQRKA